MKKTLFILATMIATAAAEASTVLISFGINSGNGTAVVDGTYLGESGQKVNKISTGGSSSYTSGTLVTSDGAATGITLTTGGVCCGSGGVLTDASAKDSALGQDNKFYDVFGQDMTTGNPMGGAINPIGSANGNFTMSLNNLSAGTYTLTMLVGRGNNYGTSNTSSFSINGSGISNISTSLDDYSTGSGATLNGDTVTGNTHTGDWMLVTYTFDVAADGTQLNIQSQGSTGNINALALTSVPEPATASLGLLGLGALLMRRRRA